MIQGSASSLPRRQVPRAPRAGDTSTEGYWRRANAGTAGRGWHAHRCTRHTRCCLAPSARGRRACVGAACTEQQERRAAQADTGGLTHAAAPSLWSDAGLRWSTKPLSRALVRPAAAEQQALEQVCFAGVLRLGRRRKVGSGVGGHARRAVLQLGWRAQAMQDVHHLRQEKGEQQRGALRVGGRRRSIHCMHLRMEQPWRACAGHSAWPNLQHPKARGPQPAHGQQFMLGRQHGERTSSPAFARSPPPPMRKPCSSSSPAPGACREGNAQPVQVEVSNALCRAIASSAGLQNTTTQSAGHLPRKHSTSQAQPQRAPRPASARASCRR